MMNQPVQLIVGLGNPGAEYATTRHNVGFMIVDALAQTWNAPGYREKFSAHFCKVDVKSKSVFLLKPMTFMNRSGLSVQQLMHFYKIPLQSVLVIHDELDLAFGTLRFKKSGGTAGHKGLKSIVNCCGGNDFLRLRVGIDKPQSQAVHDHVLSPFSQLESNQLDDVIDKSVHGIQILLTKGSQEAMNQLHSEK